MGKIRATTFYIYLISSIVAGCVPIPVPLLPGDGIYKVEVQVDELIESKATKTDVIDELGRPLKYRATSMSYKACREAGGGGLLLVAMGGMGAHFEEFRGDDVCVELLLEFDNSNRLLSYEEIPWGGEINAEEENMNLMRMADDGDATAKSLWETSSLYMRSVKYGNDLIRRIDHGDISPPAAWKLYRQRGGKPEDIQLLCRAADGGITVARLMLGWSFGTGNGVPRDSERAYMWYKLASIENETGNNYQDMTSQLQASHELVHLKKSMTFGEIEVAEQFLRNWEPGQCESDFQIGASN